MTDPDARSEFGQIERYFSGLVAAYGHDPRACDWSSASSQQIRFEALAAAAPLEGKRILDVGCGFADFYGFLRARGIEVDYHGVDLSREMVDRALEAHPGISIEQKNLLDVSETERFDVVFANGIFYRLKEGREKMMLRLVAKLFALADGVAAFNSLSAWASAPNRDEFHADPIATLRACRGFTTKLVLRHDYHPADFTIYMYR